MALWNSKEIARKARENFEKAWLETARLLPVPSRIEGRYGQAGNQHPLFEAMQRLREEYLSLGFREIVNPLFIEEKDVRKQFGPEAVAILDRCYYLAGLPRPDVGMSDEKLKLIEERGVRVSKDRLQELLRSYKMGEIEGEELIERLAGSLGTDDSTAARILWEVFPEFRELSPAGTTMTLRSHMTSGWFPTLAAVYGRRKLPVKLFSIDRCFRREQVEDASHLRSHHSASCVVMAEDASVEDGKYVARKLLGDFGFEELKFRLDEKRSRYYAPGTQTEVYARSGESWVEVATFGMYSPVALSRYRIEVPVMNLGLGVERLAMILHGEGDIRELVYPQFYREWHLSDEELAWMLYFKLAPETREAKALAKSIEDVARREAGRKAPCEIVAFSGDFLGRHLEVRLVEEEGGKKLLGPAYSNRVYFLEGNLLGSPEVPSQGYDTGITYLRACSMVVAARAERAVELGRSRDKVRVGMVRSPGDVNLELDGVARRYLHTWEKKIDVRGPVFFTAHLKVD